jgi:hypothetical protein
MAKLSLRDKCDLYENTLKRIASIKTAEVEARGLELAPDKTYSRAFALGWVRASLQDVVDDAYYTLAQGAKK